MTTTYIGEESIGVMIPGAVALVAPSQAQLQATFDATLAASIAVGIPTTIADLLALANSILAALESMLAHGLQPPTITGQAAIFASTLAQLTLQLAPYLVFASLVATGGVFAYVYDGTTAGAGAEFTTALAGGFPGHSGSDHCNMLVMGCVAGVTWTAMQAIFKTAP